MADWGIKISKEGKSINSVIPEDYIASTKYNTLKIVNEVYGEQTVDANFYIEEDVEHNLGYIPQHRAYFFNSVDNRWFQPPRATDNILCGYECDNTTYTLKIGSTILLPTPPDDTVIKWKIYIFADPEQEAWYG